MPLLLCPNDNAGMTTVNRDGVEFDMCPQCRGVWLDRGELEKIISSAASAPQPLPPGPSAAPQAPPYAPDPRMQPRSDSIYGGSGYGRGMKRRSSIFDIFD